MQKIYFYKTSLSKVCAIIIVPIPGSINVEGKKYSYVDNSPLGVNSFIAFAKRKFPTATHVNFYCKKNNSLLETIHLE